jgi:hypothetical protein
VKRQNFKAEIENYWGERMTILCHGKSYALVHAAIHILKVIKMEFRRLHEARSPRRALSDVNKFQFEARARADGAVKLHQKNAEEEKNLSIKTEKSRCEFSFSADIG